VVAPYLTFIPTNWKNLPEKNDIRIRATIAGASIYGSELEVNDGVSGARYFRCYHSSGSYIDRVSRTSNDFHTLWVFVEGTFHFLDSFFELFADDVSGAMKTRAINLHKQALEVQLGVLPKTRYLIINTCHGAPRFQFIEDISTKSGKPASRAKECYLKWLKITPENASAVGLAVDAFEELSKRYWALYKDIISRMEG